MNHHKISKCCQYGKNDNVMHRAPEGSCETGIYTDTQVYFLNLFYGPRISSNLIHVCITITLLFGCHITDIVYKALFLLQFNFGVKYESVKVTLHMYQPIYKKM